MVQRSIFLFLLFIFHIQITAQTWTEFFVQDAKDTLSTGMPIALSAAAVWYWANRIPHDWQTLEGPVADFIVTTWEEQGFVKKRPVVLKRIPPKSVLGKMVVYTQELPNAVAIGEPFINKIQKFLDIKKELLLEPDTLERAYKLQEVEEVLNEFRFVCGHERVHKERHHTYKFLVVQFLAPFVIYSGLKHTRALMVHNNWKTPFDWSVSRGITRSSLEILVGLIFARYVEYKADMYASDDITVLKAGLRLFERAQKYKEAHPARKPSQHVEIILKWVFQYTHPTLIERIAYMKKRIEYLEKQNKRQSLDPSIQLSTLSRPTQGDSVFSSSYIATARYSLSDGWE